MYNIDLERMSTTGMQIGLGLVVIPAAATSLIACSKIIVVNIIADIAVRILTANTFTMSIYGISFVAVPTLWKISLLSAMAGGTVVALSASAYLINLAYKKYCNAF